VTGVDLVRAVRRHLVVAAALVAAVLGAMSAFLATEKPTYEAKSTIVLLPTPEDASGFDQASKIIIPTFKFAFQSRQFLAKVAASMPEKPPVAELANVLRTSSPAEGAALFVIADSASPTFAADASRAAAKDFVTEYSNTGLVKPAVSDLAETPTRATVPRQKLVLATGVLLALVVGVLGALLWEALAGRVQDASDLRTLGEDVAVLGVLPTAGRRRRHAALRQQAMKDLRTSLSVAMKRERRRAVLFVDLDRDAGGPNLVTEVAALIAETGEAATIWNLEHGARLGDVSGDDPNPGAKTVDARSLVREVRTDIRTLPSVPADASREVVLAHTGTDHGVDVRLVAAMVGAAVIVVHAGKTRRRDLRAAIEGLRSADVCVLGAILG